MISVPTIQDYELLSTLPGPFAHFRFTGVFEQKTTIWDASIYSLDAYYKNNASAITSHTIRRPFIEVGELTQQGRRIIIGLALDKIEQSTIIKTMIMIRQYKRLRAGKHEFGETSIATDPQ